MLLGQGSSASVALVSVALMGVGLSLPYPLYYDEAERVLPDRPVGSLALMQVGAGLFPIPVIPLFGAALASGDADLAFAALGLRAAHAHPQRSPAGAAARSGSGPDTRRDRRRPPNISRFGLRPSLLQRAALRSNPPSAAPG